MNANVLKEAVRGILRTSLPMDDKESVIKYMAVNLPEDMVYVWKVTKRSDLNPLGRYDTEEVFYFWLQEDTDNYNEGDDTDIEEIDILDADVDSLIEALLDE